VSTEALVVAPPRDLVRRAAAHWHRAALAAIVGLAALLDFLELSQNGYANTYYAGAVRSMLKSWHNFLFASFDPGGLVSVDKPPLALWVETASAKIFGYSGFSILLPEALAGVLAVWVLYLLVTRVFGRVAGLVAALALAVSPVSVAVNRDNNPDALFVLLLVVAVYVGVRALESGRLRTLLLSAALVGLAFNTKMLAAMVIVPGLGLAYLLCAPQSWRKRIGFLAAATAVLVVVSGAWIAAVDLTPAADRPYVGSTTNNSALSLAFDYNGLGRVNGQTGGTSFGGGLGGAFSGTPGAFRLLNQALGDQGAWLLALALVGGLSALVAAVLSRRRLEVGALVAIGGWFVAAGAVFSLSSGIIHTYYLSALAPATSALVGIGAVALWRDARRSWWRLAAPLLALGLSAWLEVALLQRSGYLPWLQPLVIATAIVAAAALVAAALPRLARVRAAAATAGLSVAFAGLLAAPTAWSATTLKAAVNGVFPGAGPDFVSGLGATTGGGGFAGGGGPGRLGGRRGTFGPPPGGNFRPGGRTFTPPTGSRLRTVPGLTPAGGAGGAGGLARGDGGNADIGTALAYAKAHQPGSRWALIVSSEQEAAPSVIRGESVAAMGGFTGRETVLTNAYLAKLVRSGEARYFLLGGQGRFGPGGGNNAAVNTITSTCKPVTTSAASSGSGTLYDCAGRADAIATASG
jgi:4-amino-4-deoxy-L-arabinose transferase-like glycosyltransferase